MATCFCLLPVISVLFVVPVKLSFCAAYTTTAIYGSMFCYKFCCYSFLISADLQNVFTHHLPFLFTIYWHYVWLIASYSAYRVPLHSITFCCSTHFKAWSWLLSKCLSIHLCVCYSLIMCQFWRQDLFRRKTTMWASSGSY